MSEHKHEHHGGCCGQHHGNHEHSHEHKGGCCGQHHGHHQHNHEHKGGCCGHHHGHNHTHHQPPVVVDTNLTPNQVEFLQHLIRYQYLPVAQFLITSTTQSEFEVPALAPVFIRSTGDTMELVKESGAFLTQLEEQGMLTLDYDIPLEGYPYEEYHQSDVYAYFCATVEEGKSRPNAVGDTANLILGSMAPTEAAVALFSDKN